MCKKCEHNPWGVNLWKGTVPLEGGDAFCYGSSRQIFMICRCPETGEIFPLHWSDSLRPRAEGWGNTPAGYVRLQPWQVLPREVLFMMAEYKLELFEQNGSKI